MIIGTGVDIIEIDRIKSLREKQGQSLFDKCFTEAEVEYCQKKKNADESFAARFAAKEAVMKALSTGWSGGVNFRNIELVREGDNAPYIVLHSGAKDIAEKLGVEKIHISVSHCKSYAIAQAIAEGK